MQAIEFVEFVENAQNAHSLYVSLKEQTGFLGGRITSGASISANEGKWRVQVFFEATGLNQDTPLPDGMRFVIIPESATKLLGIESPDVVDGLDVKERSLVAGGLIIEAIKQHRNRTSRGLREAKDAVEYYIARHGQGVRS